MDNHIASLLKTSNRVIIPGFGALIAREGGEKLTFNELLKFDDGLLNDFVCKAESIDKKAAEANIKKYVEKVSAILKKGDSVKISSIGALVVDDKGKIQFEQSGSPKDVKTPPAKEVKAEPVKPVSPPPPPPPAATTPKAETKPKEPANSAKEEPKKEEPKKETGPAPKVTTAAQTEYKKTAAVNKPETDASLQKRTPPPKATPTRAPKSQGEKMKKGWVVWVIILVLLIGGGTTSWFLFTDEIKGFIQAHIGKSNKQPETPIVIDTTEVVTDTVVEIDEVIEDRDIVPLDPYAKTGQYYVVAGCFRYERNADRYVTHLQKKGYNSKKFGKRKGLYVVCFEIYPTKTEALRKMREIRNTIEPEAWVLKY